MFSKISFKIILWEWGVMCKGTDGLIYIILLIDYLQMKKQLKNKIQVSYKNLSVCFLIYNAKILFHSHLSQKLVLRLNKFFERCFKGVIYQE